MSRGGARPAGRPKGQGKYKESTKPIRIPTSMINEVMSLIENRGYELPFYTSAVQTWVSFSCR